MQTQTDDQHKKIPAFLPPLIVFILCFIIIVFSINQIIEMAKPRLDADTGKQQHALYDFAPINSLIQSSAPIDYKKFETQLSASFSNQPTLQAKFNIDPQVGTLPPAEQNYIIRLKLIEWKVEQLQDQITQISSTPSESLIFKTWFWFCSLLIWACSIVGGQILTSRTNKLIDKYWDKP